MKGGLCTSCLPQTGGACPCQANPVFGGSRRTHKKSTHKKRTHKKNKRNDKYAMLCTCKLKHLRKHKHPTRK